MRSAAIAISVEQAEQSQRENAAIARGLKSQDPELLDHLIELYQHRLLRYLLFLTGKREVAEDLFQETWMRVLMRGSPVQRQGALRHLAVYHCAQPGDRSLAQADHGFAGRDERCRRTKGARLRLRPTAPRRWRVPGARRPRRGCGGAAEAGGQLSRGAGAALPRGDVAGRDCERDARAAVHGEVAACIAGWRR